MDEKLAKYFRESLEDFQTRAEDLMFSYQCEDEDTERLLEDAMNLIIDILNFLHHIAIV